MEAGSSLWDPDLDSISTLICDESVEKLREIASEGCVLCAVETEDDD